MEIQKKIARSTVIPDTGSGDVNCDSIEETKEEDLRQRCY
jgi:hypothetical protein